MTKIRSGCSPICSNRVFASLLQTRCRCASLEFAALNMRDPDVVERAHDGAGQSIDPISVNNDHVRLDLFDIYGQVADHITDIIAHVLGVFQFSRNMNVAVAVFLDLSIGAPALRE